MQSAVKRKMFSPTKVGGDQAKPTNPDPMTLAQFVTKNAFRNRRRSILTALSIMFSLLLLTVMMTIWRGFYIDQGAPDSALRIMTRHRVSLAFFLPAYYRDKIRAVPGVVHVVPMTWFGGKYKDDRPENFFAQFATDPEEYMEVAADKEVPPGRSTPGRRIAPAAWSTSRLPRNTAGALGTASFCRETFSRPISS